MYDDESYCQWDDDDVSFIDQHGYLHWIALANTETIAYVGMSLRHIILTPSQPVSAVSLHNVPCLAEK